MRAIMLVYREGGRRVDCAGELARLRRRAAAAPRSRDAALGLLIEVGEFESGVTDALAPDRDDVNKASDTLRDLSVHAAHAWLAYAEGLAGSQAGTLERLGRLADRPLPASVELRISEGYAYYALYPDSYAASARRFFADTSPRRVHAIGIRSIGTSLSAVVTAALQRCGCDTTTSTVRPRGHPFDRELRIGDDLAAQFRREASLGAHFLIVDEGPGISGSSFAAVACWLRALGVSSERVVLFPSWDPDPASLRSETAQRVWREHPRYCSAIEPSLMPERVFAIAGPAIDFSAGRWRHTLAGDAAGWPPAHPQHERWKMFVPSESRLIRFAGLGHYGHAIAARAQQLAELGIGVVPGALRGGFLDLPFVAGSPLGRCETIEDATTIGAYIGRVAAAFPTGGIVDAGILSHMIETNIGSITALPSLIAGAEIPAVAVDGRMLPHEWIRTPRGLVKVDALDHHADHFFPGPQSPAWDLAGAEIELGMDATASGALLAAFERVSRDRSAQAWLPFYRIAYAAFRFGYATLAAETLAGTDDGARFRRAARYYSQCALNATACFTASSKLPLKQMARSSMNT